MGRPIKLSDRLAEAAAEVSRIADRSIPAQIEHWANLGRAVERSLTGHAVQILKAAEGDPAILMSEAGRKANLLQGLRQALSPEGPAAALAKISARGPRYGTDPEDPSMLVRISQDGKRTRGRLINGDFIPEQFLPAHSTPGTAQTARAKPVVRGGIQRKAMAKVPKPRPKSSVQAKRARG